MRPIAKSNSPLRYPLDSILGSEAQVRLLRVLLNEVDTTIGVSDAARLAGITPQWARKALINLVQAGAISRLGYGKSIQYAANPNHALTAVLEKLFRSEQERFDSLVFSLGSVLSSISEISQAWIEKLPIVASEPLDLRITSEVRAAPWIQEEVRSRLIELEKQFDIIVEVLFFTRADKPQPGPEVQFLVLRNIAPMASNKGMRLHQEIENRSCLLSKGIANLISKDPSLIMRAKHHLSLLIREGQGSADRDIAEWKQLLDTYSPDKVCQLLVSRSSRADRLRQSSPFFAVLNPGERDLLLSSLEEMK